MKDFIKYAQNISAPISRFTNVRIERVDQKGDPLFENKLNKWAHPSDIKLFIEDPFALKWQSLEVDDKYSGCYSISEDYKIYLLPLGTYDIDSLKEDFDEFMRGGV